jgi:hypothetical protein
VKSSSTSIIVISGSERYWRHGDNGFFVVPRRRRTRGNFAGRCPRSLLGCRKIVSTAEYAYVHLSRPALNSVAQFRSYLAQNGCFLLQVAPLSSQSAIAESPEIAGQNSTLIPTQWSQRITVAILVSTDSNVRLAVSAVCREGQSHHSWRLLAADSL